MYLFHLISNNFSYFLQKNDIIKMQPAIIIQIIDIILFMGIISLLTTIYRSTIIIAIIYNVFLFIILRSSKLKFRYLILYFPSLLSIQVNILKNIISQTMNAAIY